MVGFPSTMSSSPQHTPLREVFPIVSRTTAMRNESGDASANGDWIAENKEIVPLFPFNTTAVLRRQTE